VIIAAYGWMTAEEAETVAPKVVFVDECNRITERRRQERTPLCTSAFTD
jgi:aspartate 1-decarboxylase